MPGASTDDYALLGVCGLYCGACYHYRASTPEGKHLLHKAAQQGRSTEGYACCGCRSDVLYVHPGCARCAIRACGESRGVLHCGLCDAFPCERLRAFQSDGRAHHVPVLGQLKALRRLEPEQWLEEQARRWTCACGAPFSWYERTCARCGAALDAYK